jgi:hypothetical protein
MQWLYMMSSQKSSGLTCTRRECLIRWGQGGYNTVVRNYPNDDTSTVDMPMINDRESRIEGIWRHLLVWSQPAWQGWLETRNHLDQDGFVSTSGSKHLLGVLAPSDKPHTSYVYLCVDFRLTESLRCLKNCLISSACSLLSSVTIERILFHSVPTALPGKHLMPAKQKKRQ